MFDMNDETLTAKLTTHRVDLMTNGQRKRLAAWLRDQANLVSLSGENFASIYTARYYTRGKREKKS